ncbi:hypothetical protein [Streptomyces sp. NPDC005799]|uniref:hypothetical protein n=1 Tax=Streptomyces sp. NPDC005799 TaxID=3154678 RepID=UPI0034070D95
MTWPAALPGTALRVMRTAVVRRALQVALLAGGLFVLGFLCGEQAHAAEGAPVTSVRTAGPLAAEDGVRAGGVRADGLRLGGVGAVAERAVGRIVQAPAALIDGRPVIPAAPPASRAESPAPPQPETPAKPGPTAPTHPSSPSPRPASPANPTPSSPNPNPDPQPTGATPDARSGRPAPLPPAAPLTLPGAGDQILGSAVDGLVQGAGGHVLQPVGGLVVAVTDALGEVTAQIPPLSSLPALPALPVVPTQPGAPSLPGVPGVPGLPPLPSVPRLPTGPEQTLPAPVPQPGDGAGRSATGAGSADGRSGVAVRGTTYGPEPGLGAGTAHASGPGGGQRSDVTGYVPVHQVPGGDPTGELSSRNAVDGGTSRHGDAYAVALDRRAPLRLLAGAAARADVDATRDRHRDVPVSPA